jgi:hypothetical protein
MAATAIGSIVLGATAEGINPIDFAAISNPLGNCRAIDMQIQKAASSSLASCDIARSKFGMKVVHRNCFLLFSKMELFGTRIHVMTAPFGILSVSLPGSFCTDAAGFNDAVSGKKFSTGAFSNKRLFFNAKKLLCSNYTVSSDRFELVDIVLTAVKTMSSTANCGLQ